MRNMVSWLGGSALFVLAGCGTEGDSTPVRVDAGPDRVVAACSTVLLHASVTGQASELSWAPASDFRVFLAATGDSVSFTAPSVVVPTTVTIRAAVTDAEGSHHFDIVNVRVEPVAREAGLADGMAHDCAPFRHGVASGDPLSDGVVLWTRLTPDVVDAPSQDVRWQIATTETFGELARSGTARAQPERDYTVKVDVGGLQPSTTYYYRFIDQQGRSSTVGRTRTAPQGPVERLRFAVASCSSIYSGYFNAYRRIGERRDLDLMVHLGDYLYDFVDAQERVRVPEPPPVDPTDLEGWRARHDYYLADPDLRLARSALPWAMIWDNHDLEANAPEYNGGARAFLEWNPIREVDPLHPEILYRTLHYGDLVDLVFADALLHRNQDTVPGTSAKSILGNEQYDWLTGQLRDSGATWRLLANQRLFGTVRINPVFAQAIDGERREVFDTGAWDGFPEDRSRLLRMLVDEGIADNIVLSGDSHVSVAMDLVDAPLDPRAASAGVEFLPTSISRGNFDETLAGLGFGPDQATALIDNILADTARRNPHHRYLELTQHGYGVLDIGPEQVVAEFRYSGILQRLNEDLAGEILIVKRGTNRWER